jgi:hypothetical protein
VRAYALNAASRELLLRLRAWPDDSTPRRCWAWTCAATKAAEVRFAAGDERVPALAWIVEVEPLLARLAEAVRYQPQVEVLASPQPAALTVVCEGRASATRAEFGVPSRSPPIRSAPSPPGWSVRNRMAAWPPVVRDGNVLALLPLGGAAGELGGAGLVGAGAARGRAAGAAGRVRTPRCRPPARTSWAS